MRFSRRLACLLLGQILWLSQGCVTESGGKPESPAGASGAPSGNPSGNPAGSPSGDSGKTQSPVQNPDSGKSAGPSLILSGQNAGETWQSLFIKDSSEIPLNGFKVFYFDDSAAAITAHAEQVAFPALSYAYSGPYGIQAQRFAAYWIGKFEFAEDAVQRIDLSQSQSIARILIDKLEIYSGQASQSLIHAFPKGSHLIEIEYRNNWHTLSFSVLFSAIGGDKPREAIDTAATGAEYWYAGAYESGKSDLSVDLALKKSAKPVVLFLSSYEVVRWNVLPADSGQVLAVFVDSYQPQSTVQGLPPSVPVTVRKGIPYTYKLLPDCYAETGYCDGNGFRKLARFIGDEFKLVLTGYSAAYNPASLVLPDLILDSAKYREIEEQTRALEESVRLRGLVDVFPGDTAATWQSHFIASPADIPVGGFRAFYFSDRKPAEILETELTAAPAVAYSWSSPYGLDANDFAGYWIGEFEFAEPAVLAFEIDQGHAQTAIYVDKRSILPDPAGLSAACSLPAGKHLIEIQHVNNWHTIDFAVTRK